MTWEQLVRHYGHQLKIYEVAPTPDPTDLSERMMLRCVTCDVLLAAASERSPRVRQAIWGLMQRELDQHEQELRKQQEDDDEQWRSHGRDG